MSKNVCMFVWNHFTNDARVLRECTALSENGYSVDLICIHDPKADNMLFEERINKNFVVYRVKRYPTSLNILQSAYHFIIKNRMAAVLAIVIWFALAYLTPFIIIPLTILLLIVIKTKVKKLIVRGSIILRMMAKGRKRKYDIYHSNDLNTLPQGYFCAKWRIKRKRLVYDSHEVQTSRTGYNSPIYGKIEKFYVKRIDTMIVENHTRAKYNEDLYGFYPNVLHNYPFKHTSQLEENFDLHEILGLPKDEKILLYQGGIQMGRGLEKLIQAAPLFNEGTLVFIGDGKIKQQLLKMVVDMNLESKVKFIPKVPLVDLPKYTRNAYLGFQVLNNICFNHYSASSNKLFEYMMAGVPVVACNFPEIKKVVEGDQTGICIDPHKPEEIASAVNKLLENLSLREKLSRNSIIARNKYNWDKEKTILFNIYQQL